MAQCASWTRNLQAVTQQTLCAKLRTLRLGAVAR
jgi:hypothetical protein